MNKGASGLENLPKSGLYQRWAFSYNARMDIAKQIVDQRIAGLIRENPTLFTGTDEKNVSKAFLLLGVSAYLDLEIDEAEQYITDGGNDGGFDAAYIVEGPDMQLDVVLFQSKYTRDLDKDSNFPANAVEKAVNTVMCVFDPSSRIMLNDRSLEKVNEIRSFILDGKIPYVTFVMLNNGLSWNEDGKNHIENKFKNAEQVNFVHFNHADIVRYINRKTKINTQLSLSGQAVQENFNYKRVILGRVAVSEVHKLMREYRDSLLEKNIRRYLGKNAVNSGIIRTLLDTQKNQNFFFYNNGITLVCERMGYNALQQQDWIVKLDGLQIINGGQTCKTIYQTLEEHPQVDYSNVYVLVRIYELNDDENIVRDITYATNSQNPVDFRDLKSNNEEQLLLEASARELGYIYKRKRDSSFSQNSIPATVAAEAVLSVWRNMPHIARYRKNDLFGSYYDKIFKGLNAAQMVLAVLIFRCCDSMRKKDASDAEISAIRPFEAHFMAKIVGKVLLEKNKLAPDAVTHKNFPLLLSDFEAHKEEYFETGEIRLRDMLRNYLDASSLVGLDGRTLAAPFRRYDLIGRYIDNEGWWGRI